jgi:hypothetical protein
VRWKQHVYVYSIRLEYPSFKVTSVFSDVGSVSLAITGGAYDPIDLMESFAVNWDYTKLKPFVDRLDVMKVVILHVGACQNVLRYS